MMSFIIFNYKIYVIDFHKMYDHSYYEITTTLLSSWVVFIMTSLSFYRGYEKY